MRLQLTEITKNIDAQNFEQSKKAAHEGGDVAGNARKDLESRSGKKVISSVNYLSESKKKIEER